MMHVERAGEIDGDDPRPQFGIAIDERAGKVPTRVVDQNIDCTVPLECRFDQLTHSRFARDIGQHAVHSKFGGCLLEPDLIVVGNGDVRAVMFETCRDCPSNALRSARHNH